MSQCRADRSRSSSSPGPDRSVPELASSSARRKRALPPPSQTASRTVTARHSLGERGVDHSDSTTCPCPPPPPAGTSGDLDARMGNEPSRPAGAGWRRRGAGWPRAGAAAAREAENCWWLGQYTGHGGWERGEDGCRMRLSVSSGRVRGWDWMGGLG